MIPMLGPDRGSKSDDFSTWKNGIPPLGTAKSMTSINSDCNMHQFCVLGIETSCDETAAAVVRGPDERKILSNIIRTQIDEHSEFGGVVPEIAARAHIEVLDQIVGEAMREADCTWDDIDAVAATAGPGLIGGVIVGLMTAKAIAMAAGKPVIAINHLEGHALTARLTDDLEFPFLLLLVSGGHSQFLLVRGVGDYERLGTTIDDAIGEAFDKTAKLLGLPYPGGPAVEQMAKRGDVEFAAPLTVNALTTTVCRSNARRRPGSSANC